MDEDVFYTPDHQTSTWIIDQLTSRIQTSDPKITEQVRFWTFPKLVASCIVGPHGSSPSLAPNGDGLLSSLESNFQTKIQKESYMVSSWVDNPKLRGLWAIVGKKLKGITVKIFEETGEEGRADVHAFLKPKSTLEVIHQKRDEVNEPKRRSENS